jgi:AbrB family looped-hinge helix DNA binding protein
MSTPMPIETGRMNIYDHKGRTAIPKQIRDAMGVEEGDTMKVVVEDGVARLYRMNDDGEIET